MARRVFFLFVLLVFVFSLVLVFSEDADMINLSEGKNLVRLNVTNPIYVESLVKLNPSIESVSYMDGDESVGYVNVFGGIGENFIIDSQKEYEVVANGNLSLILPDN